MTAHFLGQSPVFCFFFYLFTWCSKWTLLRHVKNNTGQRHQQRNEFEKWNHVLFFFLIFFLRKIKGKFFVVIGNIIDNPKKKKEFFGGYYRLSLSLLYSIELLFLRLVLWMSASASPSTKEKKRNSFRFVLLASDWRQNDVAIYLIS